MRMFSMFVGLVGILTLAMVASADASTSSVAGVSLGSSNDLSSILQPLGITTTFSLGSLAGFLLKPFAVYSIGHSVYDAHNAWKQTNYAPKEFTHALFGAGGSGLLIGGGATLASYMLGSGAGAVIH